MCWYIDALLQACIRAPSLGGAGPALTLLNAGRI
jgi:hypothetical protein